MRLTGGEPLLYAELPELILGLKTLGIPDISVTTNGQPLARFAAILRVCGCERVNVSLDSVNETTFARMTGGKLDAVVAGIDAALGNMCQLEGNIAGNMCQT